MEDATTSLFPLALGVAPPWRVEELTFDVEGHRLDIHLGFDRGTRFECPECKTADCPVHDVADKEWRHLNFFQHEAYLHAGVPWVRCKKHGVRLVEVPLGAPGQWLHDCCSRHCRCC